MRRSSRFRLVILCLFVAGCHPWCELQCVKCLHERNLRKIKRTPLRFRQTGPCTFEVLDPVPPLTRGLRISVIEGGDINTGAANPFTWDAESRVVKKVGCEPDGGHHTRLPLEVTLADER